MAIYLYCLLPATADTAPSADVAGVRGVADAAVRALRAGALVAWVSDVASVPRERELAAEHARVLLAALARGPTPLPARVGQHFADEDVLRSSLARREEELAAALERLSGRVEMTLHLHLAPEAAAEVETPDESRPRDVRQSPASGRAYLERRRGELEQAARDLHHGERLRSAARASLGDLVERDASLAVRGGGRYILSHLIRRESVEAWRRRAASLRFDGVARTFVSGPLPPCSFSMLDDPGSESTHLHAAERRDARADA